MKYFLSHLFIAIVGFSLFVSCSDDDDEVLISGPIVATWNLSEIKTTAPLQTFESGPFFMNWEAEQGTMVGGIFVNAIPAMVEPTGSQILVQVLRDITFQANSTIDITYSDAGYDLVTPVTPTWKTASGYATYSVDGNQLLVFPDLKKLAPVLMDNSSRATEMDVITEMFAKGVPVHYSVAEDNTAVLFIDKALVVKILPLLQMMSDNQDNAVIKNIMEDLPAALEKTTKLEAGLNVVKKSDQ